MCLTLKAAWAKPFKLAVSCGRINQTERKVIDKDIAELSSMRPGVLSLDTPFCFFFFFFFF
jgi:hypothetical protein